MASGFPSSSRSTDRPAPPARHEFAVLDFETTGFNARGIDRIVEVAVVQLGADYRTHGEYSSLVNPGRDLGATHIHGITGSDVQDAPVFADVADDLVARLAGRVIVAHNAPFDLGFLRAEFARLGHELPPLPAVDTLALTRLRLSDACRRYGVRLSDAHTALGDARATAALFRALMASGRGGGALDAPPPAEAWPALALDPTSHRRPARSRDRPPAEHPPVRIEPGMTVCFTGEAGLHVDGRPLSRTLERELAEAAGLVVKTGVSGKLTYLVAADPHSLSAKARQARERGIPIVAQDAFWRALGIEVTKTLRLWD